MKTPKMNGNSFNPQEELLELLRKNFPEIFTEERVDCEKLKKSLGENLDENGERYGLSWASKTDCFRQIQEPTTATLKPNRAESVDFDETKNLFIEGDNLQVLRILQKSYYGKVKMIYIDPPYNTGSDSFIYPDKFQESREDYLERIGEKDEEGNLMRDGMFQRNSKDNGHYHSNWLSMMYPRLFLARNLLKPDGVIFVSIDDHEVHNLRMIMNEIFGEENFVGVIKRRAARKTAHLSKSMSDMCDYVVVYSRNELFEPLSVDTVKDMTRPVFNEQNAISERVIPKGTEARCKDGNYKKDIYQAKSVKYELMDDLLIKGGRTKNEVRIKAPFRINQQILNKTVYVTKNFSLRRYLLEEEKGTAKAMNDLVDNKEFYNEIGSEKILELFSVKGLFDNPKPVPLIEHLIKSTESLEEELSGEMLEEKSENIILDFFAGSGTTAHAVMALNAEDGGNRKCISVQLPELCAEDSEAAKAGFETIADIAKERIRRAGKKIAEEKNGKLDFENQKLDTGFKVFKLDESNFKIWRSDVSTVEELKKQMDLFVDNVRQESTQENILHELILKSGLDLNVPIVKREMDKKQYFVLGEGELIICLEDKISKELVDKILAEKPQKVVCLDRAFGCNDQLKTNTILQAEDEEVEFKVI